MPRSSGSAPCSAAMLPPEVFPLSEPGRELQREPSLASKANQMDRECVHLHRSLRMWLHAEVENSVLHARTTAQRLDRTHVSLQEPDGVLELPGEVGLVLPADKHV